MCIEGIYIIEEGRKVTLQFDMPFYAENIPKKWADSGYNSIALQVDFFKIYSLEMSTVSDRGNIEINIDEKGLSEILQEVVANNCIDFLSISFNE